MSEDVLLEIALDLLSFKQRVMKDAQKDAQRISTLEMRVSTLEQELQRLLMLCHTQLGLHA
jgi:hypothetical protein